MQAADPQTLVVRCKNQSVFAGRSAHDGVPAVPRHRFGDLYSTVVEVGWWRSASAEQLVIEEQWEAL